MHRPRRILPLAAALVLAAALATSAAVQANPSVGELTLSKRIPLGDVPSGLAGGAGSIWVTTLAKSLVVRIDATTGRIVSRGKFGPAWYGLTDPVNGPEDWAVYGDGFLWITDQGNNRLVRISPARNRIVARTRLQAPWDVAVDFGAVWVPQFEPYALARINEQTNRVQRKIASTGPTSVTTGAGSVWVVAHRAGSVLRIDPHTNAVTATIRLLGAEGAERIAFGEGAVWVSDTLHNAVERIDPASNKVLVSIHLPGSSGAYDVVTGGGYVWVQTMNGVYRIDPTSNKTTAEFKIAHGNKCGTGVYPNPGCVGHITFANGSLWVEDWMARTLLRVNPNA